MAKTSPDTTSVTVALPRRTPVPNDPAALSDIRTLRRALGVMAVRRPVDDRKHLPVQRTRLRAWMES